MSYSTVVDAPYGFHLSDERNLAADAERMATLNRQIAAGSCEVCKKMLTDSQLRKGRRCFKHRLPSPAVKSKKAVYTCPCGHRTVAKPNSSGVWICEECRRTNRSRS